MNSRVKYKTAPPTLHTCFFRLFLLIGLGGVLIVSLTIERTHFLTIRQTLVNGWKNTTTSAALLYAPMLGYKHGTAHKYLDVFSHKPGLRLLCIYNADDEEVDTWSSAEYEHRCPDVLTDAGIKIDRFRLQMSQEIISKNTYVGMAYLEADLLTLRQWETDALRHLALLLLLLFGACWWGARRSAHFITGAIGSVIEQIECLKQQEIDICALPARHLTYETAALSAAVVSLRVHIESTMVSKEILLTIRQWHWELFSGLIAAVRVRLKPESPLLIQLGDYALLMDMERNPSAVSVIAFNIAQLLDNSVTTARRLYPPHAQVNFSAALQAGTAQNWVGQPVLLDALIRHILIIGLRRTLRGFVSVRLDIYPGISAHGTHVLRLLYEDSGPFLQHWQLQHFLNHATDQDTFASGAQEVSWLLLSRLTHRLGGTLTGKAGAQSGMMLELVVPLFQPEHLSMPSVITEHGVAHHPMQPLLLVVESDKENRRLLMDIAQAQNCRMMVVESPTQAVKLAAIFPWSAMMFSGLSPLQEVVVDRVRHLWEEGIMPPVALWMLRDRLSSSQTQYWQQRGINEVLLHPLQGADMERLRHALPPVDSHFYQQFDIHVRQDLSEEILAIMPMMNQMLTDQVRLLCPIVHAFAEGVSPPVVVEQAHAVKSAALTLGYFRLAGLMDQIEHAHTSALFASERSNWQLIATLLREMEF